MVPLQTVSFQHITQILELTDQLEISREAVEIPLSPESPGVVRRLGNGKIEIVVDADVPFDEWLQSVPKNIRNYSSLWPCVSSMNGGCLP